LSAYSQEVPQIILIKCIQYQQHQQVVLIKLLKIEQLKIRNN